MTARDIARQAGVSAATVYRVMGGHASASADAVARVKRAVAELSAALPGDHYQRRRRQRPQTGETDTNCKIGVAGRRGATSH